MAGRIALGGLVACAVGALVVAALATIYAWIDQTGAREDLGPADCIIVLGSAVWPGEQPSPSLAARTARGLALYQAGHAPALILCGGRGAYPPAEAEMMRRLLAAAGVPAAALCLDDSSTTTVENLQHARAIMRAHGWQSALLVSDPFHLPRASLMAGDLGLVVRPAPALDSPTYTIPRQRLWYTLRETLALIWYVVLERPGRLAG